MVVTEEGKDSWELGSLIYITPIAAFAEAPAKNNMFVINNQIYTCISKYYKPWNDKVPCAPMLPLKVADKPPNWNPNDNPDAPIAILDQAPGPARS